MKVGATTLSQNEGWSNNIITARRLEQQHHHSTRVGATTSSQHEGWSNNIIIITGQQNEAGVTTFSGTLTVPKELLKNHKIP
jgi:hypothetical protein